MLLENTLFGTVDKVQIAIDLLRKYEPPEGYYLCFSGGKDSIVTRDLTLLAGVKFTAYHNITTVEPPELMKFIFKHFKDVVHIHPKLTMHQLIVKNGLPPLRQMRYCCRLLKEGVAPEAFKITGVRAEESLRRAKRPPIELEPNNRFIHIVHSWTAKEIWEYIRYRNLPYCSLYDEGFTRVGCVLCPYHSPKQTYLELQRYPSIADYYRRACRSSFRLNPKLQQSPNFKNGDEMFDWWIEKRAKQRILDDCQVPLFSEDDGYFL